MRILSLVSSLFKGIMFNFALEMKIKNGSKVVKTSLTTLNAFEIVLMACIMLLALSSFFIKGEFSWQNCIAAISAVLGVFCVVLGAKGSLANWIFGMFEGFLHIVICFYNHMYGDFLQRIFWNLPMQFVGWKSWRKRELGDHTNSVKTRYMTWKQRGLTFLIVSVMTVLLGIFLKSFGPWMIDTLHGILPDMQFKTLKMDYDQEAQLWLDAFTTVLSIVTLYISVQAFVEQWSMWLVINVSYITMWLMSDSEFSFMTVAKYSVYLINTFYGIWMWNKLSKTK